MSFKFSYFYIFALVVSLIALQSSYAWFLIDASIILYAAAFLSLLVLLVFRSRSASNFYARLATVFFAVYSFGAADLENVVGMLGASVRVVIFHYLFSLNLKSKVQIFNIFSLIFAALVSIGMPLYFVVMILNIDAFAVIKVEEINAAYQNFGLFLAPESRSGYFRYMSVFLEPGYLGMASALLLYPLRYDLRLWRVRLIALAALISLSMAAYALLALGYLFQLILMNRKKFVLIIGYIPIYSLCVFLAVWALGSITGDIFLVKLLSIFNDDFMDVRLSSSLRAFYETASAETLIYGIGNSAYLELFPAGGSAGWKVFVVKYGWLSLIFLVLMYLCMLKINPSALGFGLLLVFLASFTHRAYAMWEIQMLIFLVGTAKLYSDISGLVGVENSNKSAI